MNTFVKFLSQKENFDYVNSAPTKAEREKRKQELKKLFDSSNISSFSNSDYVEDNGNDSGIYSDAEFAQIKAENALFEIRKHITAEDIRETTQRYVQRRNSEILRSRRVNPQSFQFRQHGTKTNN